MHNAYSHFYHYMLLYIDIYIYFFKKEVVDYWVQSNSTLKFEHHLVVVQQHLTNGG